MWNPYLFLILLVSMLLGGCSSGGSTAGAPAPGNPPTETVTAATADILVKHVLNRSVPQQVKSLRFTARDRQNHGLFSTDAMALVAEIRLSPVPVGSSELLIEYLDDQGRLLGVYLAALSLIQGQTFVVEDPGFQDVEEAVTSLVVTPPNSSLGLGGTQQLLATATLQNGAQLNVTSQAVWSSADANTATVSPMGLATGVNPGTATLTATLAGLTGQADLTVTTATLKELVVSPPGGTVNAGTSQQFAALGIFTDGSVQDLTQSVAWSATGAATVDAQGLATGTVQGNAQIDASYQGLTSHGDLTVNGAVLVSLDIQPNGANLAPGAAQPFTVTGTFSDASTQNLTGSAVWTSTGNIAANVFNAGATGSFTVTATQGAVSQTVPVEVAQPAGAGPLLFAGHDRTPYRLLGFSQNPGTGQLTPLATGYPLDGVSGAAGTLVQLFPNSVSRTALIFSRRADNATSAERLVVNPDGTATASALYFTFGPNPMVMDWAPDGRIIVQPAQQINVGLNAYGPDGSFQGTSAPQSLGGNLTALSLARSGRFVHASTTTGLYTVPVNNPNTLGAPVALAQTGLTFLEAGPQARVLYGIANNNQIRTFTLNLTTGLPTLSATVALPGARELLLSPDQRFLFALTNGPDEVWVYPVNQANLGLGAPIGPFPAGVTPSGLTTDAGGSFLYLASSGDDTVVAYAVNKVNGQLTSVTGSPYPTGQTGLSDVMMMP